jgi:hypothetical protein
MKAFSIFAMLGCVGIAAHANVTLNSLFGDHMVLQCDLPVSISGTADPGEMLTAAFAGQQQVATAVQDGKWTVKLAAMKPTQQASAMTVTGKNQLNIPRAAIYITRKACRLRRSERMIGKSYAKNAGSKTVSSRAAGRMPAPRGPGVPPGDHAKETAVFRIGSGCLQLGMTSP